MKKEILYLTIMFLLFFIVSYTYSIFKNTIVGSLTANVNNWSFKANVTNGVVYNDGYKVKLNGTSGTISVNLNTIGSSNNVGFIIELPNDESIKYYEDSTFTKLINNNMYIGNINKNTSNSINIYYKSENNINKDIVIKIKANILYIYGVKRNINSTSTVWERINDSVGLVANAVKPDNTNPKNDFDNLYPWSDIKSYNYNATTKEITAWIGDSNFKFDGTNGEVLTYIPGFYYKREVVDEVEYQYISNCIQPGYSYSEPFSVGRYKISGIVYDDSKNVDFENSMAHSKNGSYIGCYLTREDFRKIIKKLGNEFSQMDYHRFLLQMLYLVEYADYDSQKLLGLGSVNMYLVSTGGTDELGMKSGCLVDDTQHSMIYRGIEDIYGNGFELLDGINMKDYQAYINYDYTTYESDVFDGKYQPLGYVNSSESGYITKLGYDSKNPLIGLPISTGKEEESIKDYYKYSIKTGGLRPGKDKILDKEGMWSFFADYIIKNVIIRQYPACSRLIRHHN